MEIGKLFLRGGRKLFSRHRPAINSNDLFVPGNSWSEQNGIELNGDCIVSYTRRQEKNVKISNVTLPRPFWKTQFSPSCNRIIFCYCSWPERGLGCGPEHVKGAGKSPGENCRSFFSALHF